MARLGCRRAAGRGAALVAAIAAAAQDTLILAGPATVWRTWPGPLTAEGGAERS
jgi:hypothetical protein